MEWSCVISTLLLLGESPMQGISLFTDFESSETLTYIQTLTPRLQMDWFQLSMYVQGGFSAQLSLSWLWLVRICLQDFPKWERWLLLVRTISFPQYHFLNSNLILPPFFFDKAAIPQLLDCFGGSQTFCSLGVPQVAPLCLWVALCWRSWACSCVGNWSNCKITRHKNAMQLPQNVKPQPRVLLEEFDGLSWGPLESRSILNPCCEPVNFVCCWIPWDRWVFYQSIVLWSWRKLMLHW